MTGRFQTSCALVISTLGADTEVSVAEVSVAEVSVAA
jgi:hypothetical protein